MAKNPSQALITLLLSADSQAFYQWLELASDVEAREMSDVLTHLADYLDSMNTADSDARAIALAAVRDNLGIAIAGTMARIPVAPVDANAATTRLERIAAEPPRPPIDAALWDELRAGMNTDRRDDIIARVVDEVAESFGGIDLLNLNARNITGVVGNGTDITPGEDSTFVALVRAGLHTGRGGQRTELGEAVAREWSSRSSQSARFGWTPGSDR